MAGPDNQNLAGPDSSIHHKNSKTLQIDGGNRLDLTQKLDPTHESGPALQIWAKNNGPF